MRLFVVATRFGCSSVFKESIRKGCTVMSAPARRSYASMVSDQEEKKKHTERESRRDNSNSEQQSQSDDKSTSSGHAGDKNQSQGQQRSQNSEISSSKPNNGSSNNNNSNSNSESNNKNNSTTPQKRGRSPSSNHNQHRRQNDNSNNNNNNNHHRTTPNRTPEHTPNTRLNSHSPPRVDEETHHILTLLLSPNLHDYMTRLRTKYFPPRINKLDAHVTLFHALPGSKLHQIESDLTSACSRQRPFPITAESPPFSPKLRNIMVKAVSPRFAVEGLHKQLREKWESWLSEQDIAKGGLKPHWTLLNKVGDEEEVRKSLEECKREFESVQGEVLGLVLWRYDKGWWKDRRVWEFGRNDGAKGASGNGNENENGN